MIKDVASDHVLVETNSSFTFGMQYSIRVNPDLEIRLKLLTQVKILSRKHALAQKELYFFLNLFPER